MARIYQIKRGLKSTIGSVVHQPYEPLYTKDTNELFIADANGLPIKVTDFNVVTDLASVTSPVVGKFYILIDEIKQTGILHLFNGTSFIVFKDDLSTIQDALSIVQSYLTSLQSEVDNKAEIEHIHTIDQIEDLQESLNTKETVVNVQNKMDTTIAAIKTYVDIEIAKGLEKVKLIKHEYPLKPTSENQVEFAIPLSTFNKDSDYILVVQNSTVLSSDRYTINEDNIITLNEGVSLDTSIFISILKNTIVENK